MTASCKRYVLSLLAFIAVIAFSLEAAASVKIGNLYYNLNDTDHTASVAQGKPADLSEVLVIPSTVLQDNVEYTVISIEALAFEDTNGVTTLEIPASIVKIGQMAFIGCKKLTTVNFCESPQQLEVGNEIFKDCLNITGVYLGRYIQASTGSRASFFYGSHVSNIEISPIIIKIPRSLFAGCAELETVTIPEGIEEIEESSFTSCTVLRNVSLPSTLKTIGSNAFNYCNQIESVYSFAVEPPQIDKYGFWETFNESTAVHTLHVVPEAVEAYESHEVWKQFTVVGDLQGQSTESVVLSAEGYGSLVIGESTVHNASQSVEVAVSGGEIEVKAVPDHGYEFKSLTAALADGTTVHYSFRHEGGDIIAAIPFTSGMKITARFAQPAVHTLTVGTGDGSKYNVKVAAGKAYSLDYTAPNGYTVNSVTFAGEPLQVPGLSTQTVNIQTPQLTEDAAMSIAIAAIVTGVSSDNVAAPSVIVKDDTIVISGLKCGETVTVSTLSGVSQTYSAQGDVLTITSIEEGVYVIVTARGTFKVRI